MSCSTFFGGALKTVLPPRVHDYVVWHYTSPETAGLIIKNQEFWASTVETMNDRDEMLFGMKLVRQHWAGRQSAGDRKRIDRWIDLAEQELTDQRRADSFILCASTDADSITQWDRYGHCVLGIATRRTMTKVPQADVDGGRLGPTFTTGWRPVIYDEPGQNRHLKRLFDVLEEILDADACVCPGQEHAADSAAVECILRSIVYLKDGAFSSEQEVRLYGQARATGALIESHKNAFGDSHHIRVRTSNQGWSDDKLPIVAVRLALLNDSVEAEALQVEELLRDEPAISVLRVSTPFRKIT